ncbi:hypothetical protein VNO77_37108 [Canavalia gladiata]|uniref:Uncharacterized protein n=1 Tax=Canavalia gladiata TaxID=3824 RepID=A0AAN9KAR8_CANGL
MVTQALGSSRYNNFIPSLKRSSFCPEYDIQEGIHSTHACQIKISPVSEPTASLFPSNFLRKYNLHKSLTFAHNNPRMHLVSLMLIHAGTNICRPWEESRRENRNQLGNIWANFTYEPYPWLTRVSFK